MSDPGATFRSLSRIESGLLDEREPALPRPFAKDTGLTIFIPSWNHRAYLPRALRSAREALEQIEAAGFRAQVLVADDASRDGSQRLLRTLQALYDDPRLETIFLERNLGLSRLRNLALELSKFRYVLWLDSDNELLPENVPTFLRSIADTGAAVAHGNLMARSGDETFALWSEKRASLRLLNKNYIDAFALFDAEKLLELGGYHPWFYSGSDWEMILHLISEEQEIVFVPSVLGYYYVNEMSMYREAKPRRQVINQLARRMYAQGGNRSWDPIEVGRMYHPEVGYIEGPQVS